MTTTEMRELDAWISEHVMGDKPDPSKSIPFSSEQYCHPHYTTDPADALAVLEKCLERSEYRMGADKHNDKFNIYTRDASGTAATLPLAICLFAKHLFSKP